MKRVYKTIAVLSLTVSLATIPMTAYASQWLQDSTGWKVQNDNGTYLTSQWYQNTDGKWYYIGADGYMMVNATTPDGYQVGADGAWIESQPQVTPTQSQQQPSQQQVQPSRTPEEQAQLDELNRLIEERGKRQTDTNMHLEPGDAGYDNTGEINIGG